MIYQDRFTQAETDAINTLIHELHWASDTADYLVAYMKLLSDINPHLYKIVIHRKPVVGYLALPFERINKVLADKKTYRGYTFAPHFLRIKPEEQILWFKKVFHKYCSTLEDVTDSVLGLPFRCPPETKVYNSQIHTLPQYVSNLEISKKDVMNDIKGIINGTRLA